MSDAETVDELYLRHREAVQGLVQELSTHNFPPPVLYRYMIRLTAQIVGYAAGSRANIDGVYNDDDATRDIYTAKFLSELPALLGITGEDVEGEVEVTDPAARASLEEFLRCLKENRRFVVLSEMESGDTLIAGPTDREWIVKATAEAWAMVNEDLGRSVDPVNLN